MDVGDHCASARNTAPELRNDGMGVGNCYVCVDSKFGLELLSYNGAHVETVEHTLKT